MPLSLPKAIRSIRADLTQEDLANLLGITSGMVGRWEKGISVPRHRNLFHLLELIPEEQTEERQVLLENFLPGVSELEIGRAIRMLEELA